MDAERYDTIFSIVTEAMEMAPDERDAFIASRCAADPEMKREVVSALASATDAARDGFLDGAPVSVVGGAVTDLIDGYDLIDRIGGGGQGDVYRARAHGALRRDVAIKIIHSNRETEEILRRFQRELVIYERLGEHPNIVRVDEAGETRDGRPYFVMELIDGQEIDQYCDAQTLTLRERARLVLDVCAALKHAHGQLVLHRDLKPQNILVTPDGTPKLLDFGIAKLLGADLGEGAVATTWTLFAPFTPDYASPEQVRGDQLLGVGSDVYSLAVVLYHLVTGRRPYEVRSAELSQIRRAVCEEPPLPPHTAMVESPGDDAAAADAMNAVATRRRTTVRQLRADLSGDLATILLYALRKEPKRRYRSIGEFAVDLKQWIGGAPLKYARRVGRTERVRYWLRRNRTVAVGLAIAALVLPFAMYLWVGQHTAEGRRVAERNARIEETRANAQYDAVLVASILENGLDRLARAVDRAADSPELRQLLTSGGTPALKGYVDRLARNGNQMGREVSPIESWAAYDARGVMLAHSLTPEFVGHDFAFRDYIKGAMRRVPERGVPTAYVSRLYHARTQQFYKFSIARAVREGGDTGKVIGVITTSLATSRTMGLPQIQDARYKVVLVGRWDSEPMPDEPRLTSDYLVILHPSFPDEEQRQRGSRPADPIALPMEQASMLRGGVLAHYQDPAARDHPEYAGNWLAATAPVGGTEFVVIVQVREPTIGAR